MKKPSKNISESLRGQSPAGRSEIQVSVSKLRPPTQGPVPGESNVENPPGKPHPGSSKPYADAVGGHFGGKG